MNAWKSGCKGLYYLRTETSQRAENVSQKVERNALKDYDYRQCHKRSALRVTGTDSARGTYSRLDNQMYHYQLTDSAKQYLRQVGKPNVFTCQSRVVVVLDSNMFGDFADETPTVENLVNIDPIAEMFVMGCTVDYVTELGGSYLKVTNPNECHCIMWMR